MITAHVTGRLKKFYFHRFSNLSCAVKMHYFLAIIDRYSVNHNCVANRIFWGDSIIKMTSVGNGTFRTRPDGRFVHQLFYSMFFCKIYCKFSGLAPSGEKKRKEKKERNTPHPPHHHFLRNYHVTRVHSYKKQS